MIRPLIAIVGPTASGKSAAALELAERLGGEIVNADSRQVYRGMDIGTAKPPPDVRRRVPHHLYDIADPTDEFSLATYVDLARAKFEELWAKGTFPWLVGGSGQYVWALLEDWEVPHVPPDRELRARLAAEAAERGAEALHARLAAVDPVAAERIDPRNVRRVIRALEVYEHTGVPISVWQRKGEPNFQVLIAAIDVPRDELERRIDARVEAMFASGLVEEVEALLARGVPPDAPALQSIGYAEVIAYLHGFCTLAEAVEATKRATRRLVRRQLQWFRRDDPRIRWIREPAEIELEANIFTGACTTAIRGPGRGRA
ncbi:tRNA dimethylallyltransferase [bacterium HR29]|jgi:tRNA dimethylallyltransferase|nr:tRNA dimethylallyltransferase [bacterium HR29]